MPNILSERDLIAELQKQTAGLGLTVREDGQHGLSGQAEKIRSEMVAGRPQGRLPHVMPADGT